MRILVLGCAGYIGSVLIARLLECGYEVTGVDNFFYQNQHAVAGVLGHKRFRFVKADICNVSQKIVEWADVIIPLAAIVGAPACSKYSTISESVNVRCISRLCNMTSKNQRIIGLCTNSGYGARGESLCDETSPMEPLSSYGLQKCKAEQYILERGNSVSLRLATVFGVSPRMRFDLLFNDFVSKLYFDGKLCLFEPHFMRNAVHIRDVVRAIIWMLDSRFVGVYNVALPAANLTKMQLADYIRAQLGLPPHAITIGEGKDPDQRNCAVSSLKLTNTGFAYYYTLQDGVNEVYNYCSILTADKIKKMGNV